MTTNGITVGSRIEILPHPIVDSRVTKPTPAEVIEVLSAYYGVRLEEDGFGPLQFHVHKTHKNTTWRECLAAPGVA